MSNIEHQLRDHVINKLNIGYGLVDASLTFQLINAHLAYWCPPGAASLTVAFPEMVGLEEIIFGLMDTPGEPFVLPKIRRVAADGADHYFDLRFEGLALPDNSRAVLVMMTDLTDHARLEQKLMQQRNELSLLIDERRRVETALRREKHRSETLLLNILPQPIAERLKDGHHIIADDFSEVTILFADLVGFTELAATMTPNELVDVLNLVFSAFDALAEKHELEKIKTIGDAYMVVGGLPRPRPDHAEAVAEMALDMRWAIAQLDGEYHVPLSLRIGINTGPVVAGIIGSKRFSYDLWGDTVNTASRMETHGEPGQIQMTDTTYQHLRDKYVCAERGVIPVKGKGDMTTYLLEGRQG